MIDLRQVISPFSTSFSSFAKWGGGGCPHSPHPPSHMIRFYPRSLLALWFFLCFYFPANFSLGWCFQIILYSWSQNIFSSSYCLICKESIKDKTGWGPESLSFNQKAVVWKSPLRQKHFKTKVETNMEKKKKKKV